MFNTFQRTAYNTVRDHQVSETSVGLYLKNMTAWTDWLRVTLGVRGDLFMATVNSDHAANSGYTSAFLTSPKAGVVFGPFNKTEFFLNGGFGYHSNDARGATIMVNPADPFYWKSPVPLLVQSKGAEVGVRSQAIKGLDTSLAVFLLGSQFRAPASWATPAPPRRAGPAGASASMDATATARPHGQASTSTLLSRMPASPTTRRTAT